MIRIFNYIDIAYAKQELNSIIKKQKISLDEVKNINYTNNEDLEISILQNDLFSPIKIFVIYDADIFTNLKKFEESISLIEKIKSISIQYDVYFLISKKCLSNQKFKNLTSSFEFVTIKNIDEKEKNKIIDRKLKDANLTLSEKVKKQLVSSLNLNYGNIDNEINKLNILINSNSSDVELLDVICNFNDENIFLLLESILLFNNKKVWAIYNDLILKKNDEIAIMNAMSSQIVNVYFCLKLLKTGASIWEISQVTGVASYFVTNYQSKFKNVSLSKLKAIILELYNLEIMIKLSKIDKRNGFKEFILKSTTL
ncbi:MAG: DNA polymerase III subunit delta [Mycoplasma sp.]